MAERYLVTGGAGFIGSNIVRRLLREGHEVQVLDNFSTGDRDNLKGLDVELIEGDVVNYYIVQRAIKGIDYILHQAALSSVPRSINDPIATGSVNVLGTLNVLAAATEAGVKRVVYASSCSIYEDSPELPKRETMLPAPKSPYAASKLAGEHLCRVFYETYGLKTIMLRYFNVFGPHQNFHSPYAAVIPRFIVAALTGQPAVIFGDGYQSRDFAFVDNVVEANLAAVAAPEDALGRAFNIAYGKRYSLLELLDFLEQIVGRRVERRFEKARPGDVKHSQADISAARHYLGYFPKVDFLDGLRYTVKWIQEESGWVTWS